VPRQAFQSANDIRARHRGLPDAGKRAAAASRARTWAEILRHMDATGEPKFCGCLSGDIPPALVRVVWAAWDCLAGAAWWLNVPAVAQAFGDVFGAGPITFYEWPEAGEDVTGAQVDMENGARAKLRLAALVPFRALVRRAKTR
jgi:hypothetical protein